MISRDNILLGKLGEETAIKYLEKSGFIINDIIEPKPILACKKIDKESYDKHSRVPLFIIFELRKV